MTQATEKAEAAAELAKSEAGKAGRHSIRETLGYLGGAFLVAACGLGLVAMANRNYAPEMYKPGYMATVADALASGENYTVFDLNINIRDLRNEHIQRLPKRPNVIVLGASQWQEASEDLLPNRGYLNAHVHRDYWEDPLGMVEMLVRHDKLPKHLVITIRDKLFTPVEARKDFLWLPIIPYYQAMSKRLQLEPHAPWEMYPLQRPRELLSLNMLFTNMTRWHNATDWPYPTMAEKHVTLDILRPDGAIRWSDEHLASFTQARSRRMSLEHAAANSNAPPQIDPKGVEAIDRLLSYLAVRGVKVHLAHPPFNPIYFDAVKGTPYMKGLAEVENVTRELAAKHKLDIVGSFDPAALGCTADMYIDAEHSQAPCLGRLLADLANSLDMKVPTPVAGRDDGQFAVSRRSKRIEMASGWKFQESGSSKPAGERPEQADTGAAVGAVVPGAGVVLPRRAQNQPAQPVVRAVVKPRPVKKARPASTLRKQNTANVKAPALKTSASQPKPKNASETKPRPASGLSRDVLPVGQRFPSQ